MKVIFILALLLAIFALYCRLTGNTYDSFIFGASKIQGKSTLIPFEGRIFPNWWLVEKARFSGREAREENVNLIEAFVVKWILEGRIKVIPEAMNPKNARMSFRPDNNFADPLEAELYKIFLDPSGEGLVIDSKTFKTWAKNHNKFFAEYPKQAVLCGEQYFVTLGYLDKDKRTVPDKYPQMRQAMELKNFLNDFNSAEGQNPNQPRPWKDYLVLGMLFECYAKLLPQLKAQRPADFCDYARSIGMDPDKLLYNMEAVRHVIAPGFVAAVIKYGRDTIDPTIYGT